jgi:hypothetical protein
MGAKIDRELAKSLINEYRTRNTSAAGTNIITHEGKHLNGFYIEREILEEILKNPKVTGVSVHLAKHPAHQGADNNAYTVVLGGAQPNPAAATNPVASPHINAEDLFENFDSCPTHCTDIQ